MNCVSTKILHLKTYFSCWRK